MLRLNGVALAWGALLLCGPELSAAGLGVVIGLCLVVAGSLGRRSSSAWTCERPLARSRDSSYRRPACLPPRPSSIASPSVRSGAPGWS